MLLEIISAFLDKYNLPWLILAVLSWLLIILSCSYRSFLHALPVGFWTMAVGTTLELFFINYKFWTERFVMIPLGELDLFVIIGPFFSMGILLIRFLPEGRWSKYLAVLIFSALATGIELIAVELQFLVYHQEKWGFLYSMAAYCLGLMSALGFYFIYHNANFYPRIFR